MMTLYDIPRTKAGRSVATKTLNVGNDRDSLAIEAKAKLGYVVLADDASGSTSLGKLSGPLTEALLRLEIEPLDTASVLKYQMEEAGRKTLEKIHENFSTWISGWFSPASWTHTNLSEYRQPVPEFVIRKAIQIKDALPEVTFYIQHMNEPKADPFLVAKVGEEIYYVEAWDEPRFEDRL